MTIGVIVVGVVATNFLVTRDRKRAQKSAELIFDNPSRRWKMEKAWMGRSRGWEGETKETGGKGEKLVGDNDDVHNVNDDDNVNNDDDDEVNDNDDDDDEVNDNDDDDDEVNNNNNDDDDDNDGDEDDWVAAAAKIANDISLQKTKMTLLLWKFARRWPQLSWEVKSTLIAHPGRRRRRQRRRRRWCRDTWCFIEISKRWKKTLEL